MNDKQHTEWYRIQKSSQGFIVTRKRPKDPPEKIEGTDFYSNHVMAFQALVAVLTKDCAEWDR